MTPCRKTSGLWTHENFLHHRTALPSDTMAQPTDRTQTASCQEILPLSSRTMERPQQRQDCYILNMLPPEMILSIRSELTPWSQQLLARTCSKMRLSIPNAPLDADARLEYLAILSRDLPTVWFCETCNALHPTDVLDTPADRREEFVQCDPEPRADFWPAHRHIQLALKYFRLQKQRALGIAQQAHYLTLMRPVYCHSWLTSWNESDIFRVSEAYYKIVRGRFMMKLVWRFHELESFQRTFESSWYRNLQACPHQQAPNDACWTCFQARRRERRDEVRTNMVGPLLPLMHEQMYAALTNAVEDLTIEASGSCPYCLTDFSLQSWRNYAVMCTWHDFGPEGSTTDPIWRAYASQSSGHMWPLEPVVVDHQPGIIRSAFENA